MPDAPHAWAGHYATYAVPTLYEAIRQAGTTLVFVNTRGQAEVIFKELWRINDDHLPIALHHGSLAVDQRRKVEAAMAKGGLKAVVCTSSLDLGIDWGAVDLVVQIGAPKGVSRILQRIGRANHRLDQPSRALLVPGNRFEVLECLAAHRRDPRAHPRWRRAASGRARRAGPAPDRHRVLRAVRRRQAVRGGAHRRSPMRTCGAPGLRRRARVRRDRRLRARRLRALPAPQARRRRAVAPCRSAARARAIA